MLDIENIFSIFFSEINFKNTHSRGKHNIVRFIMYIDVIYSVIIAYIMGETKYSGILCDIDSERTL